MSKSKGPLKEPRTGMYDEKLEPLINTLYEPKNDPLGSYTGTPSFDMGDPQPVQDADDL